MAAGGVNEARVRAAARRLARPGAAGWWRPWAILFALGLLAGVEWVASPLETALGRLMVWSQPVRPEAGRGWELNREGAEAGRRLGRIVEKSEQRRVEVATLADWSKVPELLARFHQFSVSPARFLTLYTMLSPAMQRELIPPLEVLRVRTGGRWQRVFFVEESEKKARVYLVDPHNVVLAQARLGEGFFRRWTEQKSPLAANLDSLEQFLGRSFPAEQFFQSIAPAGPVELFSLDPRWIASLKGQLRRVAVAARPEGNLREIAFETATGGKLEVWRTWIENDEAQALFQEMMDRALGGDHW